MPIALANKHTDFLSESERGDGKFFHIIKTWNSRIMLPQCVPYKLEVALTLMMSDQQADTHTLMCNTQKNYIQVPLAVGCSWVSTREHDSLREMDRSPQCHWFAPTWSWKLPLWRVLSINSTIQSMITYTPDSKLASVWSLVSLSMELHPPLSSSWYDCKSTHHKLATCSCLYSY